MVEAKTNAKQAPLTHATLALIKGEYKLIYYTGYQGFDNRYELFNLKQDPEELKNLYKKEKAIADSMQNELAGKLSEMNRPYQRS